ncbi:hypothetical protein RchiOBHm_Chr5g0067121 [Rosa chinensis]|uniref:Uncharacterized protein n=1 Tax=Rosa chinensis TaxID=74649 RepID=A0A2P6QJC5_ROSCH|nr:hypothetical protein RchiOBHm_Chr5g0067121 [Rosa chinensis]
MDEEFTPICLLGSNFFFIPQLRAWRREGTLQLQGDAQQCQERIIFAKCAIDTCKQACLRVFGHISNSRCIGSPMCCCS